MEIGKKLKEARLNRDLTQEVIAEKLNVSRQTISNWENEKSYPDIISVIELSSLYSISLDDLLKGDERMMEHLEESTNVVKSNQKLIGAIILNIITVILLITLSMFLPDKIYYLIMVFCLAIVSSAVLLYQIIRRCSRSTRCWQGACCTPPPAHHSWNRHRRHNNPHNRPNSNHH